MWVEWQGPNEGPMFYSLEGGGAGGTEGKGLLDGTCVRAPAGLYCLEMLSVVSPIPPKVLKKLIYIYMYYF